MSKVAITQYRREKDAFFKDHPHSPLNHAQKAVFKGLRYFEYNADLILNAQLELFETNNVAQIMTTDNEIRNYERYGTFTFGDSGARLTVYKTPHGFFLPFSDASKETYSMGRYLDVAPGENDRFYIDFNLAYNPFCAFSDEYSCPITPKENHLSIPILAGEKLPDPQIIKHK